MILEAMLQRLYTSLQRGPCLNARPHNSRQRVDWAELDCLRSVGVDAVLPALMWNARKATLPAGVPIFRRPEYPESEWSDEQKTHARAWERQNRLLKRLHDIATDAQEYVNDHGESALFVGFPLISMPPKSGDDRYHFRSSRVLAPLAFVPVTLSVRRGSNSGVTIAASGEGADLLIPNPALLAWIEQQTGSEVPELFEDDTGEDPGREFAEILAFVCGSLGVETGDFSLETSIVPIPRAEALPDHPALLSSGVLGLFPLANPGLLRDTKWMIGNEPQLGGPVTRYLKPEALEPPSEESDLADEGVDGEIPAEEPISAITARSFDAEYFIAPIDPSQAATAAAARSARALVIHGPPGTGKSQTITNIIGDHLARGQRVLFVCDKRTALDVVLHRLDHCGLGHLCGIVHDPARDRRDLYMGLRERMETLVDSPPVTSPFRALEKINQRLTELNKELSNYLDLLQRPHSEETESFHELVGRWLNLSRRASNVLPLDEAPEIDFNLIESNTTDIREAMHRAAAARLASNPFFEATTLTLERYFELGAGGLRGQLVRFRDKASAIDQCLTSGGGSLNLSTPLEVQAEARDCVSKALKCLLNDGELRVATAFAAIELKALARWYQEWKGMAGLLDVLDQDLEQEWMLILSHRLPALGEAAARLCSLEEYAATRGSFFRFLVIKKKKAAAEVLKGLSAPLTDENVDRAIRFFTGIRVRWLVADFCQRIGIESVSAEDDEALRSAVRTLRYGFDIAEALAGEAQDETLHQFVHRSLSEPEAMEVIADQLNVSARRARRIAAFIDGVGASGLFRDEHLRDMDRGLRENAEAAPLVESWIDNVSTVEDVVRLEDLLGRLPSALSRLARILVLAESSAEQAEIDLQRTASQNAIRHWIENHPDLLRVDTARINAAFDEYGSRISEKMELSGRFVVSRWDSIQRERLLASTGTRMSPGGAALRNRLFVRGKRALKLRQMIAAGEGIEGGDPLFDLCPVWMASPSTVAQIFPRRAVFDVIVFDEASQCRLEEALPVLLRGDRVVVAGDPKQLPPTRFFESSVAESDDGDPDTLEELVTRQMSETEDLLSASLNLDVEEAFLDVHYRSRNEALIGFSNETFYKRRLQPIPGHPRNKALQAPIRLTRVDGTYRDRTNPAEALAAVQLVAELMNDPERPSIGIVSFNINQRDLILETLEERAEQDAEFAARLVIARQQRGRDSFEGLFVRNLESVQGDERDHIIISTTFGPDIEGKFRRNFGALSRVGGDRRLNVLVTRARAAIHVLTSVPSSEYRTPLGQDQGGMTGRHQLYAYLHYAERVESMFESYQDYLEGLKQGGEPVCEALPSGSPSAIAVEIGQSLHERHGIGSTVHWGNDGFCVDVALTHPVLPEDVTLGLLVDFNRFRKTPDPVAWEYFRTEVLRGQGWRLQRLWSPILAREPQEVFDAVIRLHHSISDEVISGDASGLPETDRDLTEN